jgi:thiol-disulfide isomerase/thioredoxin
MKKIIYLLVFAVISCGSPKVAPVNYVLFSGNIENPVGETATVIGNEYTAEFLLNEKGYFSDTLYIAAAGFYSFATGRESSVIYLNPGDSIHVSLNTNEFDETINYIGKGAEKNNYLAKKYMESELNGPSFDTFFALGEDEFMTLNNQLHTSEIDLLMASQLTDEQFVEAEKKALKYDFLVNISNYKEYHIYLSKDMDFEVSPEFYNKLQGFDYNNEEDYNDYASYRKIVANHYIKSIETEEELQSTFAAINMIESEEIKNDLLNNFRYSFSPAHPELDTFYKLLMETSTDTAFEAALSAKYDIIKDLTPGNTSPSFNYPDRNGNEVSLEDLRGKYVYVDVWATWCGPCKREIPSLKELTAEFKGKDIAFVSISIDERKDYDKWTAMLDEKEMEGIQIFADNDWKSDFVKAYNIQGIPRFILIDKEGVIISADADRPSNPALKETLNSLL